MPSLRVKARFSSSIPGASAGLADAKPIEPAQPAQPAKPAEPAAVIVQIGATGQFNPFVQDKLLGMNRVLLLLALKHSEIFSTRMKDTALDSCTIEATVSQSKTKPAADAVWKQLEGITSLSELFQDLGGTAGDHLFLRVGLPSEAAGPTQG